VGKDIQHAFGARVRRLRKDRNWSQEKMAEASGLHWTYIGQVERGERNVTLQSVHAIARALRMKIADLFRGIE
jgi:XRE family transcriptional regulator, regulator of sulfur utilization